MGLLERLPQRINERPPYYLGRDYLETLMASQKAADWVHIRCWDPRSWEWGRAGEGEAQAQVRPCLLPALTVRCCWDLCRPISSLCRNTRPTPTSSCRGGSGHWRVPLACEKTINFILLKLRPFCDPEAAPSCSQEPFLDPCPFPSPLPSQQLPSLSLPHSLKAPSCPHRASPMQVAAGAQRGLDHKEATGDYWGGGPWPAGVWVRAGCVEEGV